MASSIINLKALGLNFSPNALELPLGSLIEANNVIIRRDNVIESRRGYKLFGEVTPTSESIKQLMVYRQRILRYYGNKLAYQDGLLNSGDAKFSVFSGNYSEVEPGLRIKSVQAKNGNFYFTTSDGIKKISALNGDEFSTDVGYITQAGGIKALDLQANAVATIGDQESFLPENSTVAYKLVWGKIDANNVELLGTPSERVVVYNPLKTLLQMDFNRLLVTLDSLSNTNSLINDGTYYSSLKVTKDTNAVDLRANMIALAKKIDEDLIFATDTGSGAAYNPLNISTVTASSGLVTVNYANPTNAISVSSTPTTTITATGHSFLNGDLIQLTTTGTLPSPLTTTATYYVINSALNSIQLSTTYNGTAISVTSIGSGVHTATASRYFNIGDKVFLKDFKSNNVAVDNLNGAQTIASIFPLTFIARDYTTANPVGISGTIQSTSVSGSEIIITTTVAHKLKNSQKVNISGTATAVDGNRIITVVSPTSFKVTSSGSATSNLGIWSIVIDGIGEIQSNKYRSITEPIEVSATTDTGIVDVRGTGAQLFSQQTYLNTIISLLKAENTNVINTTYSTSIGLETFSLTKTASVNLEFTVPHNIDSSYYYKLYRTETLQVTSSYSTPLEDLLPGVDYRLALQNYYDPLLKTTDNTLIISDTVPSAFLNKENLYTNINTSGGEDSKPNDYPPFAHDINTFKGYTFYANTKLKQIKDLELLGVSKLKDELAASRTPKILISDGSIYNNCEIGFVRGVKQIATITVPGAALPNIAPNTFTVNTGTDIIIPTGSNVFLDNYIVKFSTTGTLPSPLDSNTFYYVINSNATDFQVSLTFGGTPIDITTSGTGTHTVTYVSKYIDINSAGNTNKYRIWFDLTGSDVAPPAESRQLIKVYIPSNTQADVVQKISDTLNMFVNDFSSTFTSPTITINNLNDGASSAISFGAGMSQVGNVFSTSITTTGVGESVSGKIAVISSNDLLLPSVATQEATRSFIRVLNRNTANQTTFDTYAYYSNTNPGLFLLEGTTFVDSPYYLSTNNSVVGSSFSPDVSPLKTNGAAIADAGGGMALLTFGAAHGFLNGDTIVITNSTTSPDIDGVYQVEYVSPIQLKIQATVSAPGSYTFSYSKSTLAEFSDNYTKKNRVYYSKFEQPEAVSVNVLTGNYIDVGSEEAKILRIFPLRDSLFIFKEDGLYRLSAETEPFIVALFDSSCILLAPDSVNVSQNIVYGWTTQGISTVSESGVAIASRPIDTEVLKLQSANYSNFKAATFGIGYESDNSYIVWTVSKPDDVTATQAFRYSSLTGTWTKYTKSNTCGILNSVDDKLYLGVPNLYRIEQERKSFAREDYSDYEYDFSIGANNYFGNVLGLSSVVDLDIGDVVTQEQTLTTYQFNSLLKKLDNDVGIVKSGAITAATLTSPTIITSNNHGLINGQTITISNANTIPSINGNYVITYIDPNTFSIPIGLTTFISGGVWTNANYYSLLNAKGGDNLRNKIVLLANKLDLAGLAVNDFFNTIDAKSGTVSTASLTSPTIITSNNHGLFSGRVIQINGANTKKDINGSHIISVLTSNTFSVPINVFQFTLGGVWSTSVNSFNDIKACYNKIIEKLNTDSIAAFSNYLEIKNTNLQEAVITDVNYIFNKVTLNKTLDFIQGPIKVYKAIQSSVVYAPITFGDSLSFKHIREATAMFASKAFTKASLAFSTDLLPAFVPIEFDGGGSGLFGHDDFGYNFFGGVSNSAPIRTIIPSTCQRCRFMNIKFLHQTAREQYALYGITLTGRTYSTRAYR